MGTSAGSLRCRTAHGCHSGTSCLRRERYDPLLVSELHRAIVEQDPVRIQDVLDLAPALKEQELLFPQEPAPMTALALALILRQTKATRALLDAGVSPNLPISEQQRITYARRSHLAALNGGDPDLQLLVPGTHFEALCSVQHKELFMLLLDRSANPNSGIVQVCLCGDLEMLEAVMRCCGEPNSWLHQSTPLLSAVKSRIDPYQKVLLLLRASADPNCSCASKVLLLLRASADADCTCASVSGARNPYPPLSVAARKRELQIVKVLLEASADVNRLAGEEGLPNALFWAVYWGELELLKIIITHSKNRLDLNLRKHTNENVFDVAEASRKFSQLKKPKHIAKLPLPNRPVIVYDKICELLEDYRLKHPDSMPGSVSHGSGKSSPVLTGSTTATRGADRREPGRRDDFHAIYTMFRRPPPALEQQTVDPLSIVINGT